MFVFDGKPPELKGKELQKRREIKERYIMEYEKALAEGDLRRAFSKAVMTSRLTSSMVENAKILLSLLGIPYIQAPSEGEAQTSYIVREMMHGLQEVRTTILFFLEPHGLPDL